MKKKIVSILSFLFPSVFINIAYKKITNPQIRKLRENELEILEQSKKEIFEFKDFKIQTYQWGDKGETILLIHGWEGQAGNFSDMVYKLVEAGYKVRAFDGPSHGFSSKGRTSLLEFSELIGVLIKKYNAKKLISHSFGGVATTYALWKNPEIEIDKYLLLTTPNRFLDRIDYVISENGISNRVKSRLIKRFENEINYKVESLNVSEFVKTIKVNEALIIHDKNDKVLPIQESITVNKSWPHSKLIKIEGTGHFRILRTEKVFDLALDFIGKSNSS